MKTPRILLSALFALAAGLALRAAPKTDDARADVIFFEPRKFTDIKDSYSDVSNAILDQIREHIVTEGKSYVPAGGKLTVTITDIDLAGDFEPASRLRDIRIVREIYPPRINLAFKLTDAEGNELKHGTRELTDPTFMQRVMINTNDALRFEKALLDDWMRADLERVK